MNIGELIATLGADIKPLRAAIRTAENELRRLERTAARTRNIPIGVSAAPVTASLRDSQRALRDFGKTAKDSTTQFNDDLLKLGRTLASFAAVFYTLKSAFRVFAIGIEFQKTIEDTGLSLTGLVASLYDYRDATGNVLQGVQAFEAAGRDVIKIQNEMRIAGIETAATYQQLMEALQQAFAPARDAGVALGQMVPFVQRLTQVAQTAGVPMHMLNEELRSFTTGVMTRRTTRIMPYMESIGLTNERIREFIKQGTLFEETMKRTEQIALMAGKSVNTWTVALSNLYDAFQNIMGVGMEATFGALKNTFLELTYAIVQINKETMSIEFNPQFLAAIRTVDRSLQSALLSARSFAKEIITFQQAHPMLTQLGVDIGGIGLKLAGLALITRLVIGSFGWLGRGITNSLKSVFTLLVNFVGKFELAWLAVRVGWLDFAAAIRGSGFIIGMIDSIWAVILRGALIFTPIIVAVTKLIVILGLLSAALAAFGNYTIPNATAKLWDWIKGWEILGWTIEERLQLATLSVRRFATYFGVDLKQMLSDVVKSWKQIWSELPGYASQAFRKVIDISNSVVSEIQERFDEVAKAAKFAWSKIPQFMKDALEEVYQVVSSGLSKLSEYFNSHPVTIKLVLESQELLQPGEFDEAGWVNMGVKAQQKFSQGWRVEIADEMGRVFADNMWRGYSEASDVHIMVHARRMRELFKEAGEVEPAWIEEVLRYGGIRKKKEAEADKGAGKGVESAINRWRSLMDTLEKEIARASDNSLAQIDAWRTKFLHDLENVALKAQGAIGITEGVVKLNEATTAKLTDLYEDYTKWYAQQTDDRIAAIASEYREATQKYSKIRDVMEKYKAAMAAVPAGPGAEALKKSYQEIINWLEKLLRTEKEVPAIFDRKNIKQAEEYKQQLIDAYKEQWSALKGIIPDMGQQAKIGLEIVQLENKISDSKYVQEKLGREILIQYGLWTNEDERRVKALQEQVKYYKEIQAIVEDLKTGTAGIGGFFAAWSYERSKDIATRSYESFKDLMDSMERDVADAISSGIIGALRGKETDFSEMFFSMAEAGIKRAVGGLVSTAFDQLALFGLGMFGLKGKPDGTPANPYYVSFAPGVGDLLGTLTGGYFSSFGGFALADFENAALANQGMDLGFADMASWMNELTGSAATQHSMLASSVSNFYSSQNQGWMGLLSQVGSWLSGLFSIIGSFFSSLFGGFGGGLNIGAGLGPLPMLPGLQHGGQFTVGGPSGIDKALVAFRATKGEKVTVTRPGQDIEGGGVTIDARTYIVTPEPGRFHASREQIESKRIHELRRALRNM